MNTQLLVGTHPALAQELVFGHEEVTARTTKKSEWKCTKCGVRWTAAARDRVLGRRVCPECPRTFTFVSDVPYLNERWSWRNATHAENTPAWDHVKRWWTCPGGHDYWATGQFIAGAYRRGKIERACPDCRDEEDRLAREVRETDKEQHRAGVARRRAERKAATARREEQKRIDNARRAEERRIALVREQGRDLASNYPDLVQELVSEVDPSTVSIGSGRALTWRCAEGHEWDAVVKDRCGKSSDCPYCSGRLIIPGSTDLKSLFPAIAEDWHPDNEILPDQISPGSNTRFWWKCSDCGHEWETAPLYRCYQGYGCPRCAARGHSRGEEDLAQALVSAIPDLTIERNVRGRIGGRMEIDLYLPEHEIGIEFNGLYWHAEQHKGRTYHLDKLDAAREHGVELIQVWEHEWRDRREAVLALLLSKVGALPGIGARVCDVRPVSSREAREFFELSHVQGASRMAKTTVGLYRCDELIAALALRFDGRRDEAVVERFSSTVRVIGGFSRLLRWAENEAHQRGVTRLVTFSDNCTSSGRLYEATGFVRDGALAPDYRYVVPGSGGAVLENKRLYRKSRFERDPNLFFDPDMTERELAWANSLHRVWDAGKVRWVRNL